MKKKREALKSSWMASFTDMVTLLMCFFVLLFAMSEVDQDRFEALADAFGGRVVFATGALGRITDGQSGVLPDNSPPIPLRMDLDLPISPDDEIRREEAIAVAQDAVDRHTQMQAAAEGFRTYLAASYLSGLVDLIEDPMGEYIRFRFTDDMLFYSGDATLTPRAIETVDLVASRLAEEFAGHRIVVEGHTDSDPIGSVRFPSNHHLASARALSVMMRMVDVHGLSHDQVDIAARGDWNPIATNETPEGRAANRRVEILVFSRQVDVE